MGMFGAKSGYDTALTPQQEAAYRAWAGKLSPELQNTSDYDLRGAYLASSQEAGNGHLPDTWKKPNHMTFSDESQYSTPQAPGGQWVGSDKTGWAFHASPANLQSHDAAQMWRYFKQFEPQAGLLLPIDYSLPPKR